MWRMEFFRLPNPIETFEPLFKGALGSLLRDLSDKPWYIRERQVVNLLVFDHLVPQFLANNLDIGQVAVEIPVWINTSTSEERPATSADIAVWTHNKATNWKTCRPLARVEWKHISCRRRTSAEIREAERDHKHDVDRLCRTSDWARLNFAILTRRQAGRIALSCEKIVAGHSPTTFFNESVAATGDEECYLDDISKIRDRPCACSHCLACQS